MQSIEWKTWEHRMIHRRILALFLPLLLISTLVAASKPGPPVTASIGDSAELLLTLTAHSEVPVANLQFFLPPEVRFIDGGQPWIGPND